MEETVLKIALAGLCHDLGKLAQGCMEVSQDYQDRNSPIYQPVREGRYSHLHALFTAAFLEKHQELFPPDLFSPEWGDGDIFLNLAASHHKPENPMQWIVAVADRIASGLDRARFNKGEAIAWRDFKTTRLLPVFEALGPDRCQQYDADDKYQYAYPLRPLSAQSIFAQKRTELERQQAKTEYQELFDYFLSRLRRLLHRDNGVRLWAQHFDSLLMVCTTMIPAARVGDVVHDVSLYDHSRATAALAAALYGYHKATDSMDEAAIKNGAEEKFLLVSGDFFGIQEFIFASAGESCRFRSKLLRGRSFTVSLFSDLAAEILCDRLGLPFLSVVMNAAGKFHLIAPNTDKALLSIKEVKEELNDWLFSISYGQSSIGISVTAATPDQFTSHDFAALWQRHMDNMEVAKQQKVDLSRHGGVVASFLDSFHNEAGLCPLCGKRPALMETRGDRIFRDDELVTCAACRDHVMLGTTLVKNRMLAVCDKNSDLQDKGLLMPIFDRYQVMATDNICTRQANEGSLVKLWELETDQSGALACRATVRMINGHVPIYTEDDNKNDLLLEGEKSDDGMDALIAEINEGAPKTLNHIAITARRFDSDGKARGTEALGVLKADVDHLGMLFGCGFSPERFTFSRLATLSRQLNNFFALYLPHLLRDTEEFSQVYTVFAGGDDLFLIGPWNRMADLAAHLRQRFRDYVCGNQEITFSAGITLHKPHVPIDKLAETSEEALAMAKAGGRDRITMFGQTVTWDDFQRLTENRDAMRSWLERNFISRVMFYRFNRFIDLAEQEGKLGQTKSIPMSAMECVKWPAMFHYHLARNVNTKTPAGDKAVDEVAVMAKWLTDYRGGVRIPLWQILYEERA